ncbi:MAG: TonB-dependent receptor [Paucimonas sp.]|jgi:iron complex outermembrane receptor protein/outer membrane receptor for ferric coprogen and ferric-rhodotorulic acid|nr:TonB-dependent receptor [Paucimonas sp.]
MQHASLKHLALAIALSISSQSWASPMDIDLPRQPLAASLRQLAESAHLTLAVDNSIVPDSLAPAVRGQMEPLSALSQLLQGSGLTFRQQGTTLVILRQDDNALELGATSVNGTALGETTEGTGAWTTGAMRTATKLRLSMRETPQSVSVITRQRMDDQNLQNLDDVARTTTGVSYTKIGTDRSTYYARGFEINDLQFDGIPSNISESYSMDVMSTANMALYDRVEVVRGANGLMQGTGNPSAAINLVRKRPTADFRLGAELGAGSWDNYRGQVDISGPLDEQGRIRGRAVAYYNSADSYRDGAGKDNQLLYLIGEMDLTDSTTWSLGLTLQQDNNDGYDWGGLNTRADGSFYPLSRSTSLAGDWAFLDRTNQVLFSDLKHHFDNGWDLTLALNSVWSSAEFLSSYPARTTGDNYRLVVSHADYKDRQLGLDLYASGPFSLFGREHQLMLGANARKDDFDVGTRSASNTPTIDINDFDYSSIPAPLLNATRTDYNYVRRERGLYGATRLSLSDDLSLILGTRLSWSDYQVPTDRYRENGRVVPYAGLVFDLDSHHSLYASYTEIYKTQSSYAPGNSLLEPVDGENYETGIKGEYFGGALNLSLALFQTDLRHMPEAIPGVRNCGVTASSTCYQEGGKVRNRGFEVEVSGEPLDGWNLSAGYTYSDPEYVAGNNKGNDYYTRIPRRLLKVSSDYRLPGVLDRWRVGGDVFAQSRTSTTASTYDIRQGGYALLNLHANVQLNRQLSLQYNLNNALDKKYYQSLPTSNNWGGLYYGDPRNFAVTLRYQY